MPLHPIGTQIRRYLVDTFFQARAADFRDDESLLARGILDSTAVLEVVAFIERTYGIRVADEDLVPENLDSIAGLAAFVAGKLGRDPHA